MLRVKRFLFLLAIGAAALACSLPSSNVPENVINPEMVSTGVAATQTAMAPESPDAIPEDANLLPRSLYFLSEAEGDGFQVWMIAASGSGAAKLTSEPDGVDEYAVSGADGRIAYITNNQLVVLNPDGVGRTVLVDGSGLIEESDAYYFTQQIRGLSWSPDGSLLSYGQDGLHIYNFVTSTDSHVIPNDLDYRAEDMVFPNRLYTPLEWSPDGSLMLVNIGFNEAGTLGIYNPSTGEVSQLGSKILCCHEIWSPDSRSIVIASPFIGMIESGLWRVDTSTGAASELIPTTSLDDTLNFAGWPVVLPGGELRYFYSNTPEFPSGDVPLLMVQSASDGVTDRTILRPEEWLNFEALWAADGSLAVTVQPDPATEASWPRIGPILVVPATEGPVVPLGVDGYALRWGP